MGGKQISGDIPVYEINNEWEGWGTALKPSHEPICMARKPLSEKSVAENCLKWGTGGINIDESRVESNEDMSNIKAFGSMPENKTDEKGFSRPWMNDKQSILDKQNAAINKMKSLGRFPANLIHDNSEEVRECFPESKSNGEYKKEGDWENTGDGKIRTWNIGYDKLNKYAGQEGSASRFFKSIVYVPKASKSERNKGCEGLEEKKYNTNITPKEGSIAKYGYEKAKKIMEEKCSNQNNHPTVKPIALME